MDLKLGVMYGTDVKVIVVTCVVCAAVAVTLWLYTKSNKKSPKTLDKAVKVALKLIEKQIISHDTRKFRFALPTQEHILGLPVGGFISVSATIDDKLVVRPYTPITSDDEHGYMDIMFKVYKDGKMSSYLDNLPIGDNIMVRGPMGKINYLGKSNFEVEKSRNVTYKVTGKKVGMVAGGSGITPMLQLINEVLKQDNDNTLLSLLYSNKTAGDILCKEMLDDMCTSQKFNTWHTLTQSVPENWEEGSGRVNKEMVMSQLPGPAQDTVILVCGPPGLVKSACQILREVGHEDHHVLLY